MCYSSKHVYNGVCKRQKLKVYMNKIRDESQNYCMAKLNE